MFLYESRRVLPTAISWVTGNTVSSVSMVERYIEVVFRTECFPLYIVDESCAFDNDNELWREREESYIVLLQLRKGSLLG